MNPLHGTLPGKGPSARSLLETIFEPDQVMPDQFRSIYSGSKLPPQSRLYREVMESFLHDLVSYAGSQDRRAMRLYDEAVLWLQGRGMPTISFVMAVESGYLGLDPDVLREGLLRRLRVLDRGDYIAARASNREGLGTRVGAA